MKGELEVWDIKEEIIRNCSHLSVTGKSLLDPTLRFDNCLSFSFSLICKLSAYNQ